MGRQQIFYIMEQVSLDGSMEIVLLTTNSEQVKNTIVNEIRHGNLEYDGEDTDEMEKNFIRDWDEKSRDEINDSLRLGYYGYGIDGAYGQVFGNS